MPSTPEHPLANITFRAIRPADEPFLNRLYNSTRWDEMALTDWSESEKKQFLDAQFAAQHKYYREQFTNAEFSLVSKDGRRAGRLYIDRRKDEIRLIDIALLPEYRGRGVGGALMEKVLDEGRRGNLPVRIHVEQFNPAIRLYHRLGFTKIGDEGPYFLMEWRPPADSESDPDFDSCRETSAGSGVAKSSISPSGDTP